MSAAAPDPHGRGGGWLGFATLRAWSERDSQRGAVIWPAMVERVVAMEERATNRPYTRRRGG
eukprot:COSAG03_NODE_16270_length_406_cov_14.824104_1_plen_61_part_01